MDGCVLQEAKLRNQKQRQALICFCGRYDFPEEAIAKNGGLSSFINMCIITHHHHGFLKTPGPAHLGLS